MSILLWGDVQNDVWSGKWYFAKNQMNSKDFHYRRVSDNLSKPIFDFVSFNSSSTTPQSKQRGRKKHKNKEPDLGFLQRYCLFFFFSFLFLCDSNSSEKEIAASTTNSSADGESKTQPSEEVHVEDGAQTILIPHRHLLFGLWEGSFKVSNQKGLLILFTLIDLIVLFVFDCCLVDSWMTGVDEDIDETFFIFAFNGERDEFSDTFSRFKHSESSNNLSNKSSLPEQFLDLPPDPRVCLLFFFVF